MLATVLVGQFMALLDAFIVNVAAPDIRTELHASGAALQLIISGYTITYAVLLITGARLGARVGHRRMFLIGIALFTAASLACGVATGSGELIAYRLVQGAGSALAIPQVLTMIQRTYTEPERRTRALNAYSAVIAVGAAAGQVIGGVLVTADVLGLSWRPVFLVNVPIGVVLLICGARVLPAHERPERPGPLDLGGLVTLALAVTLLVVPLVLGQQQGWPLWCVLCLAGVVPAGLLFGLVEARATRRGEAPLVSGRVLRTPGIGWAVGALMVAMAGTAGLTFAVQLQLQGVLGESALHAGLTFLPQALLFGVVGLGWKRLPARMRGWLVPLGFAVAGPAFAVDGGLLRNGWDGGAWLFAALAVTGIGVGAAFSPLLTVALGRVRPQDAADASGMLVTANQLGLLLGVAVFGTLYLNLGAGGHAVFVTMLAAGAGLAVIGVTAGLRLRRLAARG
ncbi:MFS transporter [Mangrovactinospora gilvigrisea]|uniref:MFS transporter n=1 Tax=Mangrovactinospora gilvigrisea TaxID=1428644 RepID=A0A1J7C868_9ACTN|nr:MFS transporter [Mangrovactinospora gilvigrisea]OIV37720.1 MFS transporter [Mangrovactinospora gilvigrisea]